MDKKRRQESEGWPEREGEGFLQRGKPRQARIEAAPTRRRLPARFLLCEDDGDEEEVDLRQNS